MTRLAAKPGRGNALPVGVVLNIFELYKNRPLTNNDLNLSGKLQRSMVINEVSSHVGVRGATFTRGQKK